MTIELNANLTFLLTQLDQGGFDSRFPLGGAGPLLPGVPDVTDVIADTNQLTAVIGVQGNETSYECSVDGINWTPGLGASGLTIGTSYTYRLRGRNEYGPGPEYTEVISTLAATTGGTPPERQFSITIEGDSTLIGESPSHSTGILNGKSVFTGGTGAGNGDLLKGQFTNEVQYNGRTSIKCTVPAGYEGSGSFGGIVDFLSHSNATGAIQRGDEVWIRVRVYFPAEYIFHGEDTVSKNKFLRIQSTDSSAHNDLYTAPFDNYAVAFINEPGENNWEAGGLSGKTVLRDTWQTFEWYMRFDEKDAALGGNALIRSWVDGILEIESNERRLLNSATDTMRNFKLFQWWGNGGSPVDQSVYVDVLDIRTSTPPNTDANGNPFIGV